LFRARWRCLAERRFGSVWETKRHCRSAKTKQCDGRRELKTANAWRSTPVEHPRGKLSRAPHRQTAWPLGCWELELMLNLCDEEVVLVNFQVPVQCQSRGKKATPQQEPITGEAERSHATSSKRLTCPRCLVASKPKWLIRCWPLPLPVGAKHAARRVVMIGGCAPLLVPTGHDKGPLAPRPDSGHSTKLLRTALPTGNWSGTLGAKSAVMLFSIYEEYLWAGSANRMQRCRCRLLGGSLVARLPKARTRQRTQIALIY